MVELPRQPAPQFAAPTACKILIREDISQPGQATMEEFMGSGIPYSMTLPTTDGGA